MGTFIAIAIVGAKEGGTQTGLQFYSCYGAIGAKSIKYGLNFKVESTIIWQFDLQMASGFRSLGLHLTPPERPGLG